MMTKALRSAAPRGSKLDGEPVSSTAHLLQFSCECQSAYVCACVACVCVRVCVRVCWQVRTVDRRPSNLTSQNVFVQSYKSCWSPSGRACSGRDRLRVVKCGLAVAGYGLRVAGGGEHVSAHDERCG